MAQHYCIQCGQPTKRNGIRSKKYCSHCNIYETLSADRVAMCRYMVSTNPELVEVVWECGCKSDKKVRHHFDYAFPYKVFLLCHSCHIWMHSVMRSHNGCSYVWDKYLTGYGERLLLLRNKLDMNQCDFALFTDVSQQSVSLYEKGKPIKMSTYNSIIKKCVGLMHWQNI